jgi:hypothetical protein
MRLIVIVVDGLVSVDGEGLLNLDLSNCQIPENVWALQWYNDRGEIEFIGRDPNEEIVALPEWANLCLDVWEQKKQIGNREKTPEEIIYEIQADAKLKLGESDWTQLPDVNLANQQDWDAYRNALRIIATSEILDPIWPIKPPVIWITNE